jgi:hypothetical protein
LNEKPDTKEKAVIVHWDDVLSNVIVYSVRGSWTWDDFYFGQEQAKNLIHKFGTHASIDIIVDLQKSRFVPNDVLTHMRKIATRETSMNLVVLVTKSLYVSSLFKTLKQFVHKKTTDNIHLVETLEQAYDVINLHREQRA